MEEAPGSIVLGKGSRLYCISKENDVLARSAINIYYATAEEAIMSLFRFTRTAPIDIHISTPKGIRSKESPLYLNAFVLTAAVVLEDLQNRKFSEIANVLKASGDEAQRAGYTMNWLRKIIRDECRYSNAGGFNTDGFSFEYKVGLRSIHLPGYGSSPDIEGRIKGYAICHIDRLVHLTSYQLKKEAINYGMATALSAWYTTPLEAAGPFDLPLAERAVYPQTREPTIAVLLVYLFDRMKENPNAFFIRALVDNPPSSTSPFSQPSSSNNDYNSDNDYDGPPPLEDVSPRRFQIDNSNLSPRLSPSYPAEGQADPFESLLPELVRVIGLNTKLEALDDLCRTSTRMNNLVCSNEVFWQEKLRMDFPPAKGMTLDDPQVAANRKPEGWTWKQYYRELVGKIEEENALVFADLDAETMEQLNALPPLAKRTRINEMRREAGLGQINFPPLPLANPGVRRGLFREARAGDEVPLMGIFPLRGRVVQAQAIGRVDRVGGFDLGPNFVHWGPPVENPDVGVLDEQDPPRIVPLFPPENLPVAAEFNRNNVPLPDIGRYMEDIYRYLENFRDEPLNPRLPPAFSPAEIAVFDEIINMSDLDGIDYGEGFNNVMLVERVMRARQRLTDARLAYLRHRFDRYIINRNPFQGPLN